MRGLLLVLLDVHASSQGAGLAENERVGRGYHRPDLALDDSRNS
jgi:hypothetical protein